MGKKRKKKCQICMKHDHSVHECTYMCEPCSKGDECKHWCMAKLCMKFHKIIKKICNASSHSKIQRALEKLDAFERSLEDALEYFDDHEGRKIRSCSTKKGIRMLQKSGVHLREKYEEKFESEESSDDEEWIYPLGVPMVEVKGVNMGVSQRSHQNPIETPTPTSGNYLNEVTLQTHNLTDALDVCKINAFASNKQESEFSASKTIQAEIQESGFECSTLQQVILFGSFLHIAMQGERKELDEAKFTDFEDVFSQIEDQASLPEYQQEQPDVVDIIPEFCEAQIQFQKVEDGSENIQNEEQLSNLVIFESISDFCDVLVVDQEQIDLFLSNLCEEEANTLMQKPESIQIQPKEDQVDSSLNLKIQEQRLLEPKSDSKVKNQHFEMLQMLKKQSLMVSKFVFHIEPLMCHYKVNSNLFEKLIATDFWMKLIMEMFSGCMSMFIVPEVAKISKLGVFKDQSSMPEVYIADFLKSEIQNQVLQMQDDESDDSYIHVSHCLNQILQSKDQENRFLSLILQNPCGFKKDVMFWMFYMLNLQSLMSKMIQSQRKSCFNSTLPEMCDFEEKMFMDHMDHVFFGCWKHYVFMQRCLKVEYADLLIQGSLKIQADFQVLMPELQKSDFQSQFLMLENMQRLILLMSISYSWSVDILIQFWFHKFILYDVLWMYLYMMGSQPWHVAIKWCTCNHLLMRGEALKGKFTCNSFSLLTLNQGKVVVFLVVCSIRWIKFQPLWFAIKKVSTSLMDKALGYLIRDCGSESDFVKIQPPSCARC